MFRVLVVDDEEEIRLGLCKLIDWQALHFDICGTAGDGLKAAEMIRTCKPDLLLMDVRMPHLSGLELLEEARRLGFTGDTIILSGFSEFEYAQKAISLGVVAYLLKPINEAQLISAVLKAREDLEKKERSSRISQQYRGNERRALLEKLITGKVKIDMSEFHAVQLDADEYQVFSYEKFYADAGNLPWRLEQLLTADQTDDRSVVPFYVRERSYFLLCGRKEIARFERILKHYQEVVEKGSPLDSIFLVYGRAVETPDQIPLSYRDVVGLEMRRFFCSPNQHVLPWTSLNELAGEPEFLPDIGKTADRISETVLAGNRSLLEEKISQLEQQLIHSGADCQDVQSFLVDLVVQIRYRLIRSNGDLEEKIPRTSVMLEEVRRKPFLHEAIQYILESVSGCISISTDTVMQELLWYVDHNYYEPLKLESLAELFGYSSTYLGKLFFKTVGMRFNAYLDDLRIRHAAELLKNRSLHVYEIAQKVGYTNVDYFYRKFRRITGMTPAEYRQKESPGE
ncbi:MAG: response regulator [Chordicoccus sp.]